MTITPMGEIYPETGAFPPPYRNSDINEKLDRIIKLLEDILTESEMNEKHLTNLVKLEIESYRILMDKIKEKECSEQSASKS